jgi:hypothetical protein
LNFLLDTNVVSEIRRGRDPNVASWAGSLRDSELFLSVLTLGEIRKGIDRLQSRDPTQARVFNDWLDQLRVRFADRIVPVDDRIADRWGSLNDVNPRNTVDSLLAATAYVHGLTVATRNAADFEGCEVRLLNPWQPDHP